MRIVHLCRRAPPQVGGMEAVIAGLAQAQRAAGHAVDLVSLRDPGLATEDDVQRLRGVGPRRWPLARGLRPCLHGADVVHVHGIDGLLDQALWLARGTATAVGLSTHGGYLHTRRQWALKQAWLRTGTASSLARTDGVWCTSAHDREQLGPGLWWAHRRGVPVQVVPNGVAIDALLGLPRRPQPGRVLVWGRMAPHKGLIELLSWMGAAQRAGCAWTGVSVRLVGAIPDPAFRRTLARRIVSEGLQRTVTLVGPVSSAARDAEFSQAAWALQPSTAEGFGLALVESMAAGLWPVVRPIPAFVERVVRGETGDHWQGKEAKARIWAKRWRGVPPPAHVRRVRDAVRGLRWSEACKGFDAAYALALVRRRA